jgi:hypothetical protein
VADRFFEFKVLILILYGHIYKGQALDGEKQTGLIGYMGLIGGTIFNDSKFAKYLNLVTSANCFLNERRR